MNEFRKRVREKRKELGLTMEQLGKLAGTTKSYIWEIENREDLKPSINVVSSICRALDQSIDYMYTGKIGDKLSEFAKWAESKYKDYPSTVYIKIIANSYFFNKKNLLDEYILFVKRDFNHAFTSQDDINDYVEAINISKKISGRAKDVLYQIMKKPVYDGDISSKSGRSELFEYGLAIRVCSNNDYGDTSATYRGGLVFDELEKRAWAMYVGLWGIPALITIVFIIAVFFTDKDSGVHGWFDSAILI